MRDPLSLLLKKTHYHYLLTQRLRKKQHTFLVLQMAYQILQKEIPSIYSKYIFTTGNRIDSSSVSGTVYDPIENKFIEGAVVGLYHREDSFDLFSKKPIYFAFSDVNGHFKIENIKEGSYTIYAFQDENKNFIAEYKTEKFGFKNLPINVVGITERIPIFLYKEDLTKLGLQRSKKKRQCI